MNPYYASFQFKNVNQRMEQFHHHIIDSCHFIQHVGESFLNVSFLKEEHSSNILSCETFLGVFINKYFSTTTTSEIAKIFFNLFSGTDLDGIISSLN